MPVRQASAAPPAIAAFAGLVIVLAVLVFSVRGAGTVVPMEQRLGTGLPPTTALPPVPHLRTERPGYLVAHADPVFGSTVTRISDQSAFGTTSLALRHNHARQQPWNSDGTRLLLGYTNPGYLLDGDTYAFRGRMLPYAPVGVWSNADPDLFISVDGNRLLSVDAGTGRSGVLETFPGWTDLSLGAWQGSPSNDDRTLAIIASAPERRAVISYDLTRRAVLGVLELSPGAGDLNWASASQSGRYVVLQWTDGGSQPGTGVDLYDREMRFVRHLVDASQAGDLGYAPDGAEVYVAFDSEAGKAAGDQQLIVAVDLATDGAQEVLRTDWVGSHISCRNLDRPGWCFVSDSFVDAPRARTGGYDEIYAVRLDGSQQVQRFAHAHQSRGIAYDWTALAVPSRDGTRVLWVSDWGRGAGSPAYAYVAAYVPLTS